MAVPVRMGDRHLPITEHGARVWKFPVGQVDVRGFLCFSSSPRFSGFPPSASRFCDATSPRRRKFRLPVLRGVDVGRGLAVPDVCCSRSQRGYVRYLSYAL